MSSVLSILQGHPDWSETLAVLETLKRANHRALLAGGCVRDALLGITAQDLDIATSAQPDEVIALFPKTVEVGKAFGVVRVLNANADLEVATFRKDGPSRDGRRPDSVEFSDEKNDALRRDFTVNALFFDPFTQEVLDHVSGRADLAARCLRTVGKPQLRFEEDRLRILRAVRFAVQLDFQLEPETWSAVRQEAHQVAKVSQERIRDELYKLLRHGRGAKAWSLLNESGIWAVLFPELKPPVGEDLRDLEKLLSKPPENKADAFARLLAVWPPSLVAPVLPRLKLGKQDEKALRTRQALASGPMVDDLSPGQKIELFDDPEVRAGWRLWEERKGSDPRRGDFESLWTGALVEGKLPEAWLTGDDVKAVLQGPQIREALQAAYALQLEGKLKSREAALTWFSDWSKMAGRGSK